MFTAAQEPILIFTGDHEGITTKWERMQSNPFLYRYLGIVEMME